MSLLNRHVPSAVRHSSVHHFQRSSPKPLSQSKPNFIWSLHGLGERKFVRGIWVTWPRWPPRPYMVETFRNLLLRNLASDLRPWYADLGPWARQSMSKWWPWVGLDLFYGKVKLGRLCFYMGKSVRKSFNGRNLHQMTRVTWGICLHKNSDPKGGCLPLPWGYIHVKKKNMKNYV